jgi:hypothetical protein
LFTGVVDTSEKFIIGGVVTGDHFSAVLMTPVIEKNMCQRLIAGVNDTADKFVSGYLPEFSKKV